MSDVKVHWWTSGVGPTTGYNDWFEGEPLALAPGQAVWIRTMAVSGDGPASSDWAHMNLVVPDEVTVLKYNQDGSYSPLLKGSANDKVGTPPDYEVQWFSGERRWYPNFAWANIFLLIAPYGMDDDFNLLYEIVTDHEHSSIRKVEIQDWLGPDSVEYEATA